MNKQRLIFDLDDTLIHCNKYFIQVLQQFGALMEDWFSSYGWNAKEFKRKQHEIDMVGVELHGFRKDRFPLSLVETYEYYANLSGRPQNDQEKKTLLELGYSVYTQQIEAYPDAEQTLQILRDSGHQLYLYTGGDYQVQQHKVNQLGWKHYFTDIFISEHKNVTVLNSIIRANQMELSSTWMLGNSKRTDIKPALLAGIHTIHLPAEQEWEYNDIELDQIKPKGAFLTAKGLKDVPFIIEQYLKRTKAV